MNNNRFSELLNLYLDDQATVSEREELMQLIREGGHDEGLIERIGTMLTQAGNEEDMDAHEARKMLDAILAHENETKKIIPIWSTRERSRWAAVAAAILVVAVFAGWFFSGTRAVQPEAITLHEEKREPESAFFTGKQFVRLPDGSTVLLNDDSKLTYSTSFGKNVRQVNLVGEGYFDVQHDPSRPFVVVTGKIKTTVLGTIFNVRAYPGQAEIKVSVTRGKVLVGDEERAFGIITPDQSIAVNTTTNDFVQTDLKGEASEPWQSRFLILDDVSLEEAARTIGEKYAVKIILVNNDLKKCRISAMFLDGEDLDQVLTVVSGVVRATYAFQSDGSVKIEGKGCN
jgi:transmembrane sensor